MLLPWLQLKRYKYFSAGLLMETDPWVNISKEHPKRRHPNRRALMAARRARILKMKRKMKEDQEWQPNKVPILCYPGLERGVDTVTMIMLLLYIG